MKFLLITLLLTSISYSQIMTKADNLKSDSLEVKRISEGYLIALQTLNPDLMIEVMHPKLSKYTSFYFEKAKEHILRPTSYEQMIEFAKSWNSKGDKFPKEPMNKVYILDMYDRMASVKLVSDNWYEYLHLVKMNGHWKILNLYWQKNNQK